MTTANEYKANGVAPATEEPESTIDWLVRTCGDKLAGYGDTFLVCGKDGLWIPYADKRYPRAALAELMKRQSDREGTVFEDYSPAQMRKLDHAISTRILASEIQTFKLHDVDRQPIIPFGDGTHRHLVGDYPLHCRCDLASYRLLDRGWDITPPSGDSTDELPAVCEQFPQIVLSTLARYLLGPQKECDIIVCPTSDVGKSSLVAALTLALPGLISEGNGSALLDRARTRFSSHTRPLAESRVVVLDECGRIADWGNALYDMTADELVIEDKGINVRKESRYGTPVFIGDKLPELDPGEQGVTQRIGRINYLPEIRPIDTATRAKWLSPNEIDRLRGWLIRWAMESAGYRYKPSHYWDTPDRTEMLNGMMPINIRIMREHFDNQGGEFLTNGEIITALKDNGLQPPVGKGLAKFVKQCWPHAKEQRKAKERGWIGIGD